MKKFIWSLLFSLFFALVFATAAFAEVAPESDFEFDASTNTITKYKGEGGDVEIPATIGGIPVYVIGNEAFASTPTHYYDYFGIYPDKNPSGPTSVTIPDEVSSINDGAFRGNTALKTIKMPKNLKTLGSGVFTYCTSLPSIKIDGDIDYIGGWLFSSCYSLKFVAISGSVGKFYDEGMFFDCTSLETVTLPQGVTTISDKLFSNCYQLNTITLPDSVVS